MFTGIIEEIGRIRRIRPHEGFISFLIGAQKVLSDLEPGASVDVEGVCLTATKVDQSAFWVDVVRETLSRTTLGSLRVGMPVNLERALREKDRLGGHIVTGHTEGTGMIVARRDSTGEFHLEILAPRSCLPRILPQASIAVDGVSLTVVEVRGRAFGVAIVPHTARGTTLGRKRPGGRVNLETDYLLKAGGALPKEERITRELLEESGFL